MWVNGFVDLGEEWVVGWIVMWENSIVRGIMGYGSTGISALSGVVVDTSL